MKSENLQQIKINEPRRILIVDDEKDLVLSLTDILESYGYMVEKAYNESGATEIIKDFDAHVALLDIRLGNESGINLITSLKKICPGLLPVIMTAYAATDTAIEAIQEGAYDYLRKPLDPRSLLATLERCFEKLSLEKAKASAEEALLKRNQELEKINARLRESEQRYRLLIETMNDGLGMQDSDGLVTYVNDKFCRMTGFSRDEFIGKPLTDFLDKKGLDIYQDQMNRHLIGECKTYEIEFVKKDGRVLPTLISPQIIKNDAGAFMGSFIVISDISERKTAEKKSMEMETQLQQMQKMESIGILAGGIAHDFNNSLQAILGYSQMLILDRDRKDPDFLKLQQIENAAQRASELTQQLLAFSRKVESQFRPLDLNLEIRHVEKLLIRTIPRMIDIKLHLDPNLGVISADPSQVEQILMNLMINARDAMGEEGTLTIETENVTLSEEYCRFHLGSAPGHYILLTVSDTGHGIEKTELKRIFEPFFTTKEVGKGTGLGLSMVYGLVQKHGGYITCYSEPGLGTSFKIYFPIIEKIVGAGLKIPGDDRKEIPKCGDETILIVDDESLIRDLGKQILTKFGYRVLTADNAESALDIYQKNRGKISLIILDLIMPGMGGKRCLEELIRLFPHIKIVIASGYSADGNVIDVVKAGAKGFVKKPFDVNQLLYVVREVLDA